MRIQPENLPKLLRPGTIWKRRANGAWQRVYLESLESRLIINGQGSVDIRTEFGLEHIPKKKFIQSFEFIGWAKIRLEEIADDKNLIPSIEDPKIWMTRIK